jgi:uncharacterized membrane protein
MKILVAGLIIFLGVHLLPTFSRLRNRLVEKFGENRYKLFYSLVAAVGLIVIIIGMSYRDFVYLWNPPAWGRYVTIVLMLPAVLFLVASDAPSNIKRFFRHPMLIGIALWACAHLFANGDLVSLLLFGSFGSFALFDMWSANRRGATKGSKEQPVSNDLAVVAIAVVVYGVLIFAHPYFTGLPVIVF